MFIAYNVERTLGIYIGNKLNAFENLSSFVLYYVVFFASQKPGSNILGVAGRSGESPLQSTCASSIGDSNVD